MKQQYSLSGFLDLVILGWALFGMLLTVSVWGEVHYHEFVLRDANFTRLCETKTMLVVNESFPGPAIHVHKGDTLYVNVHNEGNYGVTIHWHGVLQPRNPWSDGPEYVTQCAINSGKNFTYEVIFSDEEGTLWWHAHSEWSRNTIHGAIVIYPAVGTTYPYGEPDGQDVLILGSWYSDDINTVVVEDLQAGLDLPVSDAYTINGQPGDLCNCSKEHTYRVKVDQGKTYLLRMINAVMNQDMFFAIADHNVTVVGMDGNYLKPFSTDYMVISPGQTMDFLVKTDKARGEYYMAIREFDSAKSIWTGYDKTNATAILEYNNKTTPDYENPIFPSSLPIYAASAAADAFKARLKSLANAEYPIDVPKGNMTTRMFITASVNLMLCVNKTCPEDYGVVMMTASLNNISFRNPTVDILGAYYRNMSGIYEDDFPDLPPSYFNFTSDTLGENATDDILATKVKILNYNETVEIVFQGTNVLNASETHPMHLHGYNFYVVGTGYGIFDPNTDPPGYNLDDPPKVNTMVVPKNGWTTIRFVANNPGVWYWHCHFDRHLTWGMSVAFIVKDGGTPETSMKDPPANLPECSPYSSTDTWIKSLDENLQAYLSLN